MIILALSMCVDKLPSAWSPVLEERQAFYTLEERQGDLGYITRSTVRPAVYKEQADPPR